MTKHRDVMGDAFANDELAELENSDPMSGLVNLADCMLVLACGLMVALVVHWNLNLTPKYEVFEETDQFVEIEGENPEPAIIREGNTESNSDSQGTGEKTYENMGTLYRSTSNGKFYYILPEEEEDGS